MGIHTGVRFWPQYPHLRRKRRWDRHVWFPVLRRAWAKPAPHGLEQNPDRGTRRGGAEFLRRLQPKRRLPFRAGRVSLAEHAWLWKPRGRWTELGATVHSLRD